MQLFCSRPWDRWPAFALAAALMIVFTGFRLAGQQAVSPEARAYLSEALDVMQKHSLRREHVDWTRLRAETLRQAAGAESTADTWEAIRFALRQLGDRHSFLQLSDTLRSREQERNRQRATPAGKAAASHSAPQPLSPFSSRTEPEGHLIGDRPCSVAHIIVPAFMRAEADAFATRLHGIVASLDGAGACAWVVDLRGNGGGNMWPMLAGLGPLLATEEPGAFDIPGQPTGRWFYADGRAGVRQQDGTAETISKVQGTVHPMGKTPPVAVLIDGGTASSGEAVAVAFRGRQRCRLFGSPTLGVSTVNQGFALRDGANLVLTIGVQVDRAGTRYPQGLIPDERVDVASPAAGGSDAALSRAVAWLREQTRVP